MSPIFKSVLNALMSKSDEPEREVFLDERDQNKLQNILA
jgi:hypothetical protein